VLTNIDLASVGGYPMPNTGVISAEERMNGLVCLAWCGVQLAD
jgi:hypothetical protein